MDALAISPDGTQLAFLSQTHLGLLEMSDGEPMAEIVKIVSTAGNDYMKSQYQSKKSLLTKDEFDLAFSADGSAVYLTRTDREEDQINIGVFKVG